MNSRHSLEREYDTLKSIGLGAGDGGEEGGVEGGVGRVIDAESREVEGDGVGVVSRADDEGEKMIEEADNSACRLARTRSCPRAVANAETVVAKSNVPVQSTFIS
jgi:hypothetical protein